MILSPKPSCAVFPLERFPSDRIRMRAPVDAGRLTVLALVIATVIGSHDAWLLVQTLGGWIG